MEWAINLGALGDILSPSQTAKNFSIPQLLTRLIELHSNSIQCVPHMNTLVSLTEGEEAIEGGLSYRPGLNRRGCE